MHATRALKSRKKKGESSEFYLLALLKQQVMNGPHCQSGVSSTNVGVETPTILLPFLNCFTDIFVVTNLHAFPFFQLNFTFYNNSE
jgi:NRPS condensation-like uncharacterized protein